MTYTITVHDVQDVLCLTAQWAHKYEYVNVKMQD